MMDEMMKKVEFLESENKKLRQHIQNLYEKIEDLTEFVIHIKSDTASTKRIMADIDGKVYRIQEKIYDSKRA